MQLGIQRTSALQVSDSSSSRYDCRQLMALCRMSESSSMSFSDTPHTDSRSSCGRVVHSTADVSVACHDSHRKAKHGGCGKGGKGRASGGSPPPWRGRIVLWTMPNNANINRRSQAAARLACVAQRRVPGRHYPHTLTNAEQSNINKKQKGGFAPGTRRAAACPA